MEPDDEVVGLFVASSATELVALVDEHCDPSQCSYALASAGGLVVAGVTKAKWPMSGEQLSRCTGLEGAVFTQQWEYELDAETSSLEWKSLQPAVGRVLGKLRHQT